ncbi:predicted protein [Streptomyces viridosporus ATCC 14672]|uniref:Predicted protein n=1 Tax=Streptomyces viridosporus (strain ATCC 14672 / DSM 40746 / JCM 4963 / KCTC 9882 / NRRL B-12104 / FH 1290) TaxID=566461 RepID=D6A9E8_STRV1|nr:predicted protein [Streptomyces viridosporus ATCC 14672]
MAPSASTPSHTRGPLAAGEQTLTLHVSGLDRLYPSEDRNLLECAGDPGLCVNEMAPGAAWTTV